MPPLVHGDLVYIGPAGAEWASSGWAGAFRVSDGEHVWRFNIVPRDGEKQFCRIIGEQSLCREARTRLDPLFIRDRQVFVFSRGTHRLGIDQGNESQLCGGRRALPAERVPCR